MSTRPAENAFELASGQTLVPLTDQYPFWNKFLKLLHPSNPTRNCRSVIYQDTPAQRQWASVGNAWVAIEHPSKSLGFYLPIHAGKVLLKFGFEIQRQTEVRVRKPKNSNMATRWPFWKWYCWKSMGSFPYTQVMCHWSLDLMFKAKLKLESGNQKIQDGGQAAILRVTSLKINRLLPMATNNMHIKFEIEIPKHTGVMLRTDRQTDGPGDSSIPPPPHTHTHTTLRWVGYIINWWHEWKLQEICFDLFFLHYHLFHSWFSCMTPSCHVICKIVV